MVRDRVKNHNRKSNVGQYTAVPFANRYSHCRNIGCWNNAVGVRGYRRIWNIVDKPPIWGITSTNGGVRLMQTTLETIDGSHSTKRFG